MRSTTVLRIISLALTVVAEQEYLAASSSHVEPNKRQLKGRFLHVTDFHPDPYYQTGATFGSGCHRLPETVKKKGRANGERSPTDDLGAEKEDGDVEDGRFREKQDLAGRWGSGVSDCDAPMSLVNLTFEYLKKEWAHEVDFVVWTGDNARHDIDRSLPRTPKEIFSSNRMMVDKMRDAFPAYVPIVPSIGNNDIYPHNVLAPGPNHISSEFLNIWRHFISDDDRHVFERGAYFSTEVIPDVLAVISLNTLYWYDSNTLVDGCRDRSNDPGALQMDWLEVQLSEFRERGMQVWLSGHVPPHMGHYYGNCYLRYGDLALRYQDTIVGHLFGHMNVDHFFFIDVQELEATSKLATSSSNATLKSSLFDSPVGPDLRHGERIAASGRYRITGRNANNGLQAELWKDFGEMPGPQKLQMRDYAVMNVAPSVIPTYLPGVRIFSYNISGVEDGLLSDFDDLKKRRKGGHRHGKKKDDCSLPENEDKPHCTFHKKPRHYSKTSPSRKNGPLSPLGYAQFYMPNVDDQSGAAPKWEIEYTTYKLGDLLPDPSFNNASAQPPPVPLHLLPQYHADLFDSAAGVKREGDTDLDGKRKRFREALKAITPWKMKDLTIGSYVRLARKLVAERKMWDKFQEYMYVSSET